MRFGAVDDDRRLQLLTSADFVMDGQPFDALQVIIPDANGRWPEDADYDGTPQPLLGRPEMRRYATSATRSAYP